MKPLPLILVSLLLAVPFTFAQDDRSAPTPIPNSQDPASSDLIAWSGMQAPQPVPPSGQQPLGPDPQSETQPQHNPTPSPQTAPAGQPSSSPAQTSDQSQTPATRTFMGTIAKQGDSYVLKTGSSSYQLDAQDKAKQFDGQKVRVIGILDPGGQAIQVQSIDPMA